MSSLISLNVMRTRARKMFVILAFLMGATPFLLASAVIDTQKLCYRGRTIKVPHYLAKFYLKAGAKKGKCSTSSA